MRVRQVIAHSLLSLLLVLCQQLGMAHAISHLSPAHAPDPVQEKQLPADMQCSQCLAFAAIGSAIDTPAHAFFCAAALSQDMFAAPAAKQLPSPMRAFDSRAPPVSL